MHICCLRSDYVPIDIWEMLEKNWLQFFWLTGEIPVTLQSVVDRLQNMFNPYITRGRPLCLDFRNQVSHNILVKLKQLMFQFIAKI